MGDFGAARHLQRSEWCWLYRRARPPLTQPRAPPPPRNPTSLSRAARRSRHPPRRSPRSPWHPRCLGRRSLRRPCPRRPCPRFPPLCSQPQRRRRPSVPRLRISRPGRRRPLKPQRRRRPPPTLPRPPLAARQQPRPSPAQAVLPWRLRQRARPPDRRLCWAWVSASLHCPSSPVVWFCGCGASDDADSSLPGAPDPAPEAPLM